MNDYEPEYEHFDDYDFEEETDFDFDNCPFGSGCYPQLGTEECEFECSLSKSCQSIFYDRKDCVFIDKEMRQEKGVDCVFFHYGKCYIDFSNYSPKRKIDSIIWRLKCRFGFLPSINQKIKDHYRRDDEE